MRSNLPLLALLAAALASGCAVDNRVGREVADALVRGQALSYATTQASEVGRQSLILEDALLAQPADLPTAQRAWLDARLAYDRGAALFVVAAPALDLAIDGRPDNPLAVTGLRQLEPLLFAQPPGSDDVLGRQGSRLAAAAVALPGALAGSATLNAQGLLGAMAALAATTATKLDGSDSPYAQKAHLSIRHNLRGLRELYLVLAPAVAAADPSLHAQIVELLAQLAARIEVVSSVEALDDKVTFLRLAGDLSQALLSVGRALGLTVSAPIDVT